jgi:hypothetical protein
MARLLRDVELVDPVARLGGRVTANSEQGLWIVLGPCKQVDPVSYP